ncbi:MAG: SagB family peptide dehydrogenase [Pseudonocardiaceae bacterium]
MTITITPGQATRRYLQALRERTPAPIDWSAAPARYKRYPPTGRVTLPWNASPGEPGLALTSTLLRHLLGLRTRWAHPITETGLPAGAPPGVVVARPAPSGGARYPIEAYLATNPAPGQASALYHYDAAHHSLDLIRTGEHRPALAGLLAAPPAALPDLVVVLAAVFWRNGFKYGDFAYRLHCQEIGVLSAQALALAEALDLTATVHLNFTDDPTRELLGLDPTREGPLAVLTLTMPSPTPPPPASYPSVKELITRPAAQAGNPPPTVTESLPHLTTLHTAASHCPSSLENGESPPLPHPPPRPGGPVQLPVGRQVRLAEGIAARASAPTGYQPRPLDPASLATVLAHATRGYPSDLPGTRAAPLSVIPYLLVQRVTGLAPGAYRYHPATHTLIPAGDPHAVAAVARGRLGPNTRHALPEAAAVLIPVGDPLAGISRFGDRWYRIQQTETGLITHRAILAATALGLAARIHSDGTTGTTDTALGLPPASLRSLSFLLLGHPRPGPTLGSHGNDPRTG